MNENKINLKNTELVTNVTAELIDEIESNKDYKENTKYHTTYYSVPSILLLDIDFLDKIEIFGRDYLDFYLYLKTHMLVNSTYYFFERSLKRIIKNYCLNFNAEIDNVYKVYNDLLSSKYIFCINDSKVLGEPIVTDPYIIYNYLLANNKKVYNRLMKRESRKREKEKSIKKVEVPSCPVESITDFNDFPVLDVATENDNIFDEIEKESFVKQEEVKQVSADDIPLSDNDMFGDWDEGGF